MAYRDAWCTAAFQLSMFQASVQAPASSKATLSRLTCYNLATAIEVDLVGHTR